MCDIFMEECKGCTKEFNIHLGDYNTAREEIEVYCDKCCPDKDISIFHVFDFNKHNAVNDFWVHTKKGMFIKDKYLADLNVYKMGIRMKTKNAKKHRKLNHPNECYFIRFDIDGNGKVVRKENHFDHHFINWSK